MCGIFKRWIFLSNSQIIVFYWSSYLICYNFNWNANDSGLIINAQNMYLQQFTNISSLDDVGKGSFFSSSSLSPLVQRTDSKQVTLGLSSCHRVIVLCRFYRAEAMGLILDHKSQPVALAAEILDDEAGESFCSTMSFWPEPLHIAVQFSRAWKSGRSWARQ